MSLKESYLGIQLGLSTTKCCFGICCIGDVAWTCEKYSEIVNLILRKFWGFFAFIHCCSVFGVINLLLVQ